MRKDATVGNGGAVAFAGRMTGQLAAIAMTPCQCRLLTPLSQHTAAGWRRPGSLVLTLLSNYKMQGR